MYDILIIGGGPAGLTAAVYARRGGKSVLVLEKESFGGQIAQSPRVENYPGFLSVSGTELADRLLEQAMESGAETELEEACSIERTESGWNVLCASGAVFAGRSVILAVGAKPRPLGLPREEALTGNGISYCAVCDGAFYRDRDVAVVGGGSTALQDALLLSETSHRVWLIHRRGSFRGERKLLDALQKRENVTILTDTVITELLGGDALNGLVIEQNGQARRLSLEGLFIAVGSQPDTAPFAEQLPLDASGCVAAGEDCQTGLPGLFAAGDCRRKSVRQLTTAVADGAVSALAALHDMES